MNKAIKLFLLSIAAVAAVSCGIARQSATNSESSEPKVQTTFFGATFGSYRNSVERKLANVGSHKYANEDLIFVSDVKFAGKQWDFAMLMFVDNRFRSIAFASKCKTRKEGNETLQEVYELLSNKYKLVDASSDLNQEMDAPTYIYFDSDKNSVSAFLKVYDELDHPNAWDGLYCNLLYTWGKGTELYQAKTLNEI